MVQLSDNAAQFRLASKVISEVWKSVIISDEVQTYVSSKGIKWKFIVKLAPWMGGFYERMVGVVKNALRKLLGRKLITLIQLQTLIKEIESTVNSRPLVYIESDINSDATITPNHFLTLNPKTGVPSDNNEGADEYLPKESSKDKLLKTWEKGLKLLNEFWRIWREQYLVSLRERTQTHLKSGRLASESVPKVGDVVQIKDSVPRGCWKIGRITELVSSRDGQVRSAKIKLPNSNVLGRPLNLLYPLECSPEDSSVTDSQQPNVLKTSNVNQKTKGKAAVIAREKIQRINLAE